MERKRTISAKKLPPKTRASNIRGYPRFFDLSEATQQQLTEYKWHMGRLQIGKILASGTYGVVYIAKDHETKTPVVVKKIVTTKLSQNDLEMVSREGATMQTIRDSHCRPAFPMIYGQFQDKRAIYIVMEYLQGKDLFDYVVGIQVYDQAYYDNIRSFLRTLCEGLICLHSLGLVHRDIKPENTFLLNSGEVIWIDLGLACSSLHKNCTSDVGTMGYMAPEVITLQGNLPHGQEYLVDVYAFGVMIMMLMNPKYDIVGHLSNHLQYVDTDYEEEQEILDTWRKVLEHLIEKHVLPPYQKLVASLTNVEPTKRISLTETLKQL